VTSNELLDATVVTAENFEITDTDSSQNIEIETVRYFPLYNSIYVYPKTDAAMVGECYRVTAQNIRDINGRTTTINENSMVEAELPQELYGLSLVRKIFYKNGVPTSGVPVGECSLEVCAVNSSLETKSGYLEITSAKSGEKSTVLFREALTLRPDERAIKRYSLNIGAAEIINVRFIAR